MVGFPATSRCDRVSRDRRDGAHEKIVTILLKVLLAASPLTAGCGGVSSTPCDGSSGVSEVGSPPEVDAADTSQEAYTSCGNLSTYCAEHGGCVEDWSAAQTASAWCPRGDAGQTQSARHQIVVLPHCGGFNLIDAASVDTGIIYVYDETTNRLIGVGDLNSWRCLGGAFPSMPIDLSCDLDGGLGYTPICLM
jgi:hypothetical protein